MALYAKSADPRLSLPSPDRIARAVSHLLRRQHQAIRASVARGILPDLEKYDRPMADALKPLFLPLWREGASRALHNILRLTGRRIRTRHACFRTKNVGIAFDVLSPYVLEAVDHAVFQFCHETNQTSHTALETAIAELRSGLREGLSTGETSRQLSFRVGQIFLDPFRAFRISQTESSRSVHQAQLMVDIESNVCRSKIWLESSDACSFCKQLGARGEVPLDEPFAIKGTGPYSVIQHPPGHPACLCAMTSALSRNTQPDLDPLTDLFPGLVV